MNSKKRETPVAVEPDYEVNVPLRDVAIKVLSYPYVQNDNIFDSQLPPNFKDNSCLATTIVNTFRYAPKSKLDLTHETLWKICKPDTPLPESNEYPLSLNEAKKFFEQFHLKFIATDIYKNLKMLYDPLEGLSPKEQRRKRNTMVPNVLRVVVHQQHAIKSHHKYRVFDQKVKTLAENDGLFASEQFYPRKDEHQTKHTFCSTSNDIVQYIKGFKEKATYVKIFTSCDIDELLLDYRDDYGILGTDLGMRQGNVKSFQVEQKGVIFDITSAKLQESQPDVHFQDATEYENFLEAYEKINRALLCETNMSSYHEQFRDVITYYQPGPLNGMFEHDPEYTMQPAISLDINKAYTAMMLKQKHLCVGDEFCTFNPFVPGSTIRDMHYYIVKTGPIEYNFDITLFDKAIVARSGYSLKHILARKMSCEILYKWKPIKQIPNPMHKHVKELWDNEAIPIDKKKATMNINIGCMDKKFNHKNRAEYFHDKKDASAKLTGQENSEMLAVHVSRQELQLNPLDFGVAEPKMSKTLSTEEIYLVVSSANTPLIDGFLPIAFMKYDLQRLELHKMCYQLHDAGIKVKGVNTDSIFVAHECKEQLADFKKNKSELFEFKTEFDKIGGWKTEEKFCCQKIIEQVQNELRVPPAWPIPVTYLKAENEQEWETSPVFLERLDNNFTGKPAAHSL